MKTKLIVLLLASAALVHAGEWKPFVGVGGVGELTYFEWDLPNLLNADEGDPPFFLTGTHIEAGLKYKQWEFYAGYRAVNSPIVRSDSYVFTSHRVDSLESHLITTDERIEESWKERRLQLGVRRKLLSDKKPFVPIVGGALEVGSMTYRQFFEEHIEHSILIWGPGQNERWSTTHQGKRRYHHDSIMSLSVEAGAAWKVAKRIELLSTTRFRFGTKNFEYNVADLMASISQMIQLRYTIE
ncbi:hypothetical protein KKH18_13320 [bacterium]|nr:hypothetical protein [bacterium]